MADAAYDCVEALVAQHRDNDQLLDVLWMIMEADEEGADPAELAAQFTDGDLQALDLIRVLIDEAWVRVGGDAVSPQLVEGLGQDRWKVTPLASGPIYELLDED